MGVKRTGPTFLYDHGGHQFTYELARDLSESGTHMLYAFTDGVTAPHGRLVSDDTLRVEVIGKGRRFERYSPFKRAVAEVRLAFDAARLAHRSRCSHLITCNMPVITVALLALACRLSSTRLTVWFQDSQAGVAAAALKNGTSVRLVRAIEAWGLRAASRVITISEAMVAEAEGMRVPPDRVRLLPNWAPISQIPVLDKENDWSRAQGLDRTFVFLYSGTLGIKHSPNRLSALARWLAQHPYEAVVLVVSEGPVAESLAHEAARDGLPLRVEPFQPATTLPLVLATADVCVVLLESHSSDFCVPSKVWSYMCAARPILGSMPESNAATEIVAARAEAGMMVTPEQPDRYFLAAAEQLLASPGVRAAMGGRARAFAEAEFERDAVRSNFERALN